MWIERFDNLEYRPGYHASGWITYEDELSTNLDIYDYDWTATSIEGSFRCPMMAEDQAIHIVSALQEEGDRNVELY